MWKGRRDRGECFAASLSPLRGGLQGPTHGEGQLCLVLVGIKSIMPEEMNFSSLFLHPFCMVGLILCLGPKEWTVKMTQRERA